MSHLGLAHLTYRTPMLSPHSSAPRYCELYYGQFLVFTVFCTSFTELFPFWPVEIPASVLLCHAGPHRQSVPASVLNRPPLAALSPWHD